MITDISSLAIQTTMSYDDMREYAEKFNVTVASAKTSFFPEDILGIFDADNELILIDSNLTYTQKRCTLVHELVHWSHGDCSCDPLFHAREEKRTLRETALLLVNPLQYAIAESMFDRDLGKIATELDVTVGVIEQFLEIMTETRYRQKVMTHEYMVA